MLTFDRSSVFEKIETITQDCEYLLNSSAEKRPAPELPARDILVLDTKLHPPKLGFSKPEGQARMLHDLASIELQAMELGVRTLAEFPDAPQGFREELAAVTISEGQHLRLCLEGIEDLGFKWGDWPVHCALWTAVSAEDSLLDRILIVHRYLEGSGLDAGDHIIRRLDGTLQTSALKIMKQINFEEIGHVDFGSRWYREICRQEKIDPNEDFMSRMDSIRSKLPKRIEKINRELRKKAGFTDAELDYYDKLREHFMTTKRPV